VTTPDAGDTPAAPDETGRGLLERLLLPNLPFVGLAVLFVLLRFGAFRGTIGDLFADTDDAMRLVEVRDFLAGQGWFDLHQYRLDPPAEMPMHWSRLVDLPIALLVLVARLVVDPASAETAAMILWPPLTLVPMILALRSLACRFGGRWAALPAVYLAVTTGPIVAQFVPGRIDHHNVQIGLTLWLLATVAGPATPRRGVASALLVAVMLAVGMETLPFVLIVATAIALRFLVAGDAGGFTRAFAATLALAVPVIAAATLPPVEWLRPACDALSISYVGLAVAGGAGLFVATLTAPRGIGGRGLALVLVGAVALAAFAAPSPRCLAGPFADVGAEVRRLWLDDVTEVQPWLVFTRAHPIDGLVALLPVLLAGIGGFVLWRTARARVGIGLPVVAVSTAVAGAIGLLQIRTVVYADVLATILVAAAIGALAERVRAKGGSVVVAVLAGTVAASPSLATAVLEKAAPATWRETVGRGPSVVGAAGTITTTTANANGTAGSACMTLSRYRGLAALPSGLVAADVNLGSLILAATGHSVVTAPYHRMQRGILDADRILNGTPEAAFAVIDRRGVGYLVHCAEAGGATDDGKAGVKEGLMARLLAGERFAGIEEVPGDPAIRVFRVTTKTAVPGG
jgi:hypothetical protein